LDKVKTIWAAGDLIIFINLKEPKKPLFHVSIFTGFPVDRMILSICEKNSQRVSFPIFEKVLLVFICP